MFSRVGDVDVVLRWVSAVVRGATTAAVTLRAWPTRTPWAYGAIAFACGAVCFSHRRHRFGPSCACSFGRPELTHDRYLHTWLWITHEGDVLSIRRDPHLGGENDTTRCEVACGRVAILHGASLIHTSVVAVFNADAAVAIGTVLICVLAQYLVVVFCTQNSIKSLLDRGQVIVFTSPPQLP